MWYDGDQYIGESYWIQTPALVSAGEVWKLHNVFIAQITNGRHVENLIEFYSIALI